MRGGLDRIDPNTFAQKVEIIAYQLEAYEEESDLTFTSFIYILGLFRTELQNKVLKFLDEQIDDNIENDLPTEEELGYKKLVKEIIDQLEGF